MTMKTYSGGCHCGAVRYEAEIDLAAGTNRCNCSICSKARAWFVFVPKSRLRLTAKPGALADYQWVPEGRDAHLHYRFCKTCGVRLFAEGDHPTLGGPFYAVAVATIEDADPDELAGKIKYVDGAHDRYDRTPQDTRLM